MERHDACWDGKHLATGRLANRKALVPGTWPTVALYGSECQGSPTGSVNIILLHCRTFQKHSHRPAEAACESNLRAGR